MNGKWASGEEIGRSGIFETLHQGLTVGLIATPRCCFTTCTLDETVSAVVTQNIDSFDYLPVIQYKNGRNRVLGLFHAEMFKAPAVHSGNIGDHLIPLSEFHLIGAGASILDFILDADERRCRFVVSGSEISGLVSLSDLQKLPVRAALLALITGFEIIMTEAIRRKIADEELWMPYLSPARQKKVRDRINESRDDDAFVDALLATEFCDKTTIIRKAILPSTSKKDLERRFSQMENLRNHLAHANDYAATSDKASAVCRTVRDIISLKEKLIGDVGAI